ncbi:invasion associated locus B family protein [Hyphomicrobium sp.]|uniref:invasion associated locus B family protein n=1 Tax=Hyphomicrobium sp. TaxID=82 RepID=UPI003F6EE079
MKPIRILPFAVIPCAVAGLAFVWAAPLSAQALAQGAVEMKKFGDWIVHQNNGEGSKICFAATLPKSKEPATANRAKIVFYISAWPKDGVKSEISIKLGYPIKPNSPIAVSVGEDEFELFAQDDRAYVADATQELKMIESMKKGPKLVVKATSARGTQTVDTYSLKGLGQALQAIAAACP